MRNAGRISRWIFRQAGSRLRLLALLTGSLVVAGVSSAEPETYIFRFEDPGLERSPIGASTYPVPPSVNGWIKFDADEPITDPFGFKITACFDLEELQRGTPDLSSDPIGLSNFDFYFEDAVQSWSSQNSGFTLCQLHIGGSGRVEWMEFTAVTSDLRRQYSQEFLVDVLMPAGGSYLEERLRYNPPIPVVYAGHWLLADTYPNPWSSIETFRPEEAIVVLTHGFQPTGFVGLPEVGDALRARLDQEGLSDDTHLIEFRWYEAITNGFTVDNYVAAKAGTFEAGLRLADLVEQAILGRRVSDPGYQPQLHFIGHSLGTMVNAIAAGRLGGVDQVTIIDSPLSPGAAEGEFLFKPSDHSLFFKQAMPFGTVRYVENFYASDWNPLTPGGPAFGQAIAGTGPGTSGVRVDDTNHTTIHSQFYANLVTDTNVREPQLSWNSPVLDTWAPGQMWPGPDQPLPIPVLPVFGYFEEAGTVDDLGEGRFRLSTASPATLSTTTEELSEDLSYVTFTATPVSGEGMLSLEFEGIPLWYARLGSLANEQSFAVPVTFLAGATGAFAWTLEPESDGQAVAEVANIQFLPEPAHGGLVAVVVLAGLRSRPRRRGANAVVRHDSR